MLGLTIFSATIAYTALNLYLLSKILPVPITLIPQTSGYRSETRQPVSA